MSVCSQQYWCKTNKGTIIYDNNMIQTSISSTHPKLLSILSQNHIMFIHVDSMNSWKYNSYVFVRVYLSYTTCFRCMFRVNKHVFMYLIILWWFINENMSKWIKIHDDMDIFLTIKSWIEPHVKKDEYICWYRLWGWFLTLLGVLKRF